VLIIIATTTFMISHRCTFKAHPDEASFHRMRFLFSFVLKELYQVELNVARLLLFIAFKPTRKAKTLFLVEEGEQKEEEGPWEDEEEEHLI
jgi:hypothetical protein